MSARFLYTARLVPIGEPVNVPYLDGTSRYSIFDARAFTVRTSPVDLCVNHDREMVVGTVGPVFTSRTGWWACDFVVDPTIPDVELEVGQPVSVGMDMMGVGDYDDDPFLREVSIVSRGAVKGAEITSRSEIKPAPVMPTSSPAAVRASNRAVAGDDFDDYRPAVYDELERRLGYRVDDSNFERANVEASRTPLQKHYAEYVAAKRATSGRVLIRPGIGRVLAVR